MRVIKRSENLEFGVFVQSQRHAARETQREYAETLGISVSYLRKIERGLVPGPTRLCRMCQAADADPAPWFRAAGLPVPEGAVHRRPSVSLAKLPATGPAIVGRDRELALLDRAWEDPNTRIVTFIAFGGVGKSAIVNEWLRRTAKDEHRGARRVFGWSFYSQGQREHTVSADLFIDAALRWFGDPKPEEGSPWDKGQRLAALVNQGPTILALDGIEPLQSTTEDGKINDPALDTLLRELAYGMNGLCLVTSRVDFPDLPLADVVWEPGLPASRVAGPPSDPAPALRVNLERLSTEAGRHLLRQAGVKGLDGELDAAVEEYEGHALALVLLGEYLAKFLDSDIAKRDLIPPFPDKTRAGRHAFRVIEAYDNGLEQNGMEAERALLRIVGLFDRPADKGCLDALRRPPAIEGVTDAVVDLTERQWREAVGTLRALRLLSPPPDPDDSSLDAHPLVREWFGLKLQQDLPEGFRQAHGRLYEDLRDTPTPTPDTLQEMEPLFHAVSHGCLAGRHREVLDTVYWPRIHLAHRREGLARQGPGRFHQAHLHTLYCLFESHWTKVMSLPHSRTRLADEEARMLLSAAAFTLCSLGRLREACQALRAVGDLPLAPDHHELAMPYSNLAEIYLATGDINASASAAAQAKESADVLQDQDSRFYRVEARSILGAAHLFQGCLLKARQEFDEAEAKQHEYADAVASAKPFMDGVRGARYGRLLLSLGLERQLRTHLTQMVQSTADTSEPLTTGFNALAVGRVVHRILWLTRDSPRAKPSPPSCRDPQASLETAVSTLRSFGRQVHVAEALLARASFHRDFGDRDQTHRDLKEALDLSTRIGLRLHETDAHLLQCHMSLDEDPPDLDTAEAALARATQLVTETGYHLRDADILILEGRLLSKRGDEQTGRAKLNEAITVARREEKDGCIYQLAIDQATRYLKELA